MAAANELEVHLERMLEKLEKLESRLDNKLDETLQPSKLTMIAEVRTMELWRAVILECMGMAFYVFLVCAAYTAWTGQSIPPSQVQLYISLVSGFGMTILLQSFGQVRDDDDDDNVKVLFGKEKNGGRLG